MSGIAGDNTRDATRRRPNFGAVLLAAGESSRMGETKALLPWSGRTLLEYQLDQLAATCCAVVAVVLGHDADRLRPLVLKRTEFDLRIVENPDYLSGKSSSIRAGVAALPEDIDAILVVAVDQPRPAWMLDQLAEERERFGAPIAVPAHLGRRGHPPIFAGSLREELLAVDESSQGLRAILRRHDLAVLAIEMSDPTVQMNLNTPMEYETARALNDKRSTRRPSTKHPDR